MGKYYIIEKVPDEVMKKFSKVLEVLNLEAQLAQEIQYRYPIFLEGYLHDGNKSAIYAWHNDFNEIETRLVTYSRMMVPELKYPKEEFAEEWQKLQVLLLEKEWVIRDLEMLYEFLEKFDSQELHKLLTELDQIAQDSLSCYIAEGGMIE